MTYALQLLTAFLGSLGFSILFNIRKDKLLPASLGGLLAWAVYLIAGTVTDSDVIRYFIASMCFTVYAEIFARIKKTPATLFLVSSAIPLIPGGSLYQTMNYAMQKDWTAFCSQGLYTLLLAVAIAAGIIMMMILWQSVMGRKKA